MGESETEKPDKEPKTPVAVSAQSSATSTATVNAEWPGFQAYSPIPPPGYMASSPQAHPYMWGVQHMMPPYGTPPHPYMAMYPHGGLYAHPSMPPGSYPFNPYAIPPPNGLADASGNIPASADVEAKHHEGKEKLPIKRSKGSLGSLNMITGKNNEDGKTTRPAANGSCSKSAESASDGSSEGSDTNSQNDSEGRQEGQEADASHSGNSAHVAQNGVLNAPHTMVNHAMAMVPMPGPGAPVPVSGPATNLNIGMDYWGAPASSPIQAMRGNVSSAPVATGIVPVGSRDNLQSQLWLQDERELKRQRRKQSNRESARRSRLRKQAECDELAQRAEGLKEENANLRSELNRFRSDYEQLVAENAALKERLGEIPEDLGSNRAEHHMITETQESSKTDQV
ncbi:bZIP transcription factor 16 isoform X2 [Spinacia oleracea]|uniref:BZIP transcription factor 16 isoform X2 n=1 Tax=Spinacia oleracea TaxID=3562 RepID=A0ABM3QV98_SPIOL|nr:bZIP transcription factor 16 isoform X2 [Spinacia oleracea]